LISTAFRTTRPAGRWSPLPARSCAPAWSTSPTA